MVRAAVLVAAGLTRVARLLAGLLAALLVALLVVLVALEAELLHRLGMD